MMALPRRHYVWLHIQDRVSFMTCAGREVGSAEMKNLLHHHSAVNVHACMRVCGREINK